MNLSMLIPPIARRIPEAAAISAPGFSMTYRQLEDSLSRIAAGLRSRHGLAAGSRVAIAMENCPEFLLTLLGAWRAGLSAVPMNARLHPQEMAYIVANSEARLVLATDAIATALGGIPGLPPIIAVGSPDFARLRSEEAIGEMHGRPEDEAWLFYTSGTTGRPKGAILTNRNLLFMAHAYYADTDALDERDTILHAAPLSHGSGLYAIPHLAKGSHNVILPGSFDAEAVLAAFARQRNVSMFAAPTMVSRLINSPHAGAADTRGLKTLIYGGAPMYAADTQRALELFGPRLYQLYGQGESPMTITFLPKADHADHTHPRHAARLASVGIARTGVAVRVVDAAGHPLPSGEMGEVVTRSDCVMAGYWANPEASGKAIRDGWLMTGDIGTLDADGYLTLLDRSKDMIISGGSNIYPREIEEVLLTHASVLEAAVVGRPHAEWGEEVVAFVVPRQGVAPTPAELDALCLSRIARYKRPRQWRMVDALPKNNYGKVLKTELRQVLSRERNERS